MASLPCSCTDALLPADARLRRDRPASYGRTHSPADGQQVPASQCYPDGLPYCRASSSYLVCRGSPFYSRPRPTDHCVLGCGAPAFRLSVSEEEIANRPSAKVDRSQILPGSLRCRSDVKPACKDRANDLGSGDADPNGLASHLRCPSRGPAHSAALQQRQLRAFVRDRPSTSYTRSRA